MSTPTLVLKVDVDTWRGSMEGVPALLKLLDRYRVRASFLFSLGPDTTGRAIRRVFRPGFRQKVSRTNVLEHYGIKTLLYGTLLPPPDIGRKAAASLRAVARAGHEVGVHCWDHTAWQDCLQNSRSGWATGQLQRAYERFVELFAVPPQVFGSAGWQMNLEAWRYASGWAAVSSHTRGHGAARAVFEGELMGGIEIPTSLPTLDELLGRMSQDELMAQLQLNPLNPLNVYTLHAELEGQRLIGLFETLLQRWLATGVQVLSLSQAAASLDAAQLPQRQVQWRSIPGRSGQVLCMSNKESP